jgi:hypothetical protein
MADVRWAGTRYGLVVVALLLGAAAACVVVGVNVENVARPADSVYVGTPLRAHLLDGQTVLYSRGLLVRHDSLLGAGQRYDLRLAPGDAVLALPLDSVVGMESYRTEVNAATLILLPLSAAATVALVAGAAVAIFGSCPTYYSDSAGTPVLEAEGFSYSIAPLFEAQDVDRLRARAGPDDTLRLEVRNEALETHYLNRLALIEARHAVGEFVLPDGAGRPVAVARQVAPARAREAAGHDLRAALGEADGDAVRSEHPRPDDLEDTLELVFPVPAGARDSVALVFRMRNSLLNTVLLYDLMLGDPGARALDWQGDTLQRVGPALALGQWYAEHMGMRIAVWDESAWREVAHLRDTGPVAWKDVAAVLPLPPGDSLRVRLTSVSDNWRIDRVRAAYTLRRPATRLLAPARATGASGQDLPDALTSLRDGDQRYLETTAGDRFEIAWDVGPEPATADSARTFLLLSQGYYIEWLRQAWLRGGHQRTAFTPSDSALAQAVARYRVERDTLERRFFATRVPVR